MDHTKYVLGMHLGHDASVTIVAEGQIIAHVLQERISRIRHDYGLDADIVKLALQEAGITASDVHRVALTGTQKTPAIIRNNSNYQISLDFSSSESFLYGASNLHDFPEALDSSDIYSQWLLDILNQRGVDTKLYRTATIFDVKDPLSNFFGDEPWNFSQVLQTIKEFSAPSKVNQCDLKFDVLMTINGIEIQGSWWSHHIAHARSNLTIGEVGERVLISIDGGEGALSGCVWFCNKEGELNLIAPHYLEVGRFYEFIASKLGLGLFGYSAGKLMGLAGYSLSREEKSLPIGSVADWSKSDFKSYSRNEVYEELFEYILKSSFGTKEQFDLWDGNVTDNRAIQVARITQSLVEKSLMMLSESIVERFGDEIFLGLTGGVALNCPTNSLLNKSFPNRVIIEPHCDDGGLSIGSALLEDAGTRNIPRNNGMSSVYAFKGINRKDYELEDLIHEGALTEVASSNPYLEISRRIINENAVIGVFSRQSETGPRALGSRSILADARRLENWNLVNGLKQRELWRPFAPAILEEELEEWFVDGPRHSPFMLFNYSVRDEKRDLIPAVVHFDGTSRVQTVDNKTNPLRLILEAFYADTKVPLLLNTSFNGPGEPIVEFVRNAVEMGKSNGINYLLIFGKLFYIL